MSDLETIFETLRPIQDYVAVARIPPEKVSPGGIIIPDTAQEKYRPFQGRVVGVGPGRFGADGVRKPPPNFKKGEIVFFGRYSGAEAALLNNDFWLIREHEIDAVLDP
jgi:chaperonin GroES